MKFIITVHLFCIFSFYYVRSNKTITLSAPNCNFNMTIKVPTTKCCCPPPATVPPPLPPTQPPTAPPGPNRSGCLQSRGFSSPTCIEESNRTYGGMNCDYYYICKKLFNTVYAISEKCPLTYTYSVLKQKCVLKPTTNCCVD